MTRAVTLALLVCLLGCEKGSQTSERAIVPNLGIPPHEEQQRNLMVGKWYGSQPTTDGGHREWIVLRSREGTYQIAFRIHAPDGGHKDQIEVGEWGVSGGIYFSIFKGMVVDGQLEPADPTDPASYNAYRLITLNAQELEYEAISSGNRFTLKRVTPSFVFPAR